MSRVARLTCLAGLVVVELYLAFNILVIYLFGFIYLILFIYFFI